MPSELLFERGALWEWFTARDRPRLRKEEGQLCPNQPKGDLGLRNSKHRRRVVDLHRAYGSTRNDRMSELLDRLIPSRARVQHCPSKPVLRRVREPLFAE